MFIYLIIKEVKYINLKAIIYSIELVGMLKKNIKPLHVQSPGNKYGDCIMKLL